MRAPHANIVEYLKQLTGGNSEINDAVDKLKELVVFETSMMQANTLTEVMCIKTFTINIRGLTVELGKTMSKLQTDSAESNFRLTHVQQAQDRIEENTIDLKKTTSQTNAKIDTMAGTIVERVERMIKSGIGRQQNESQETRSSVSEELKRWKKLAAALEVEDARESNRACYERIREERVSGTTGWVLEDATVTSWLKGDTPLL